MNLFKDYGKGSIGAGMLNYYKLNVAIMSFFETDDCIYLDGIPCDKYTLAPITFYKDKPLANLATNRFMITPYTTTRYFNRNLADQYRVPYRNVNPPSATIMGNNARLTNGDEVILTPSSDLINANQANSLLYYASATTNKITNVFQMDANTYKSSGVANIDNNQFAIATNLSDLLSLNYCEANASLTVVNKTTGVKTVVGLGGGLGHFHNILGKSTSGNLICVVTMVSGTASAPITTIAVAKINASGLVVTNLVTTIITPAVNYYIGSQEPAISTDMSKLYFVNYAGQGNVYSVANSKYTINKYAISIANETATLVPQTVNLNGLATSLSMVTPYTGTGTYYAVPNVSNVQLVYLKFGTIEYLVSINCTNRQFYNTITTAFISDTQMSTANNYQYCTMNLFKITGDVLDLVDTRVTYGGATDAPQAAFALNNNTSFVCVRFGGLDVVTVDTIANKFLLQDTINEPIYSLGIDSLERIWYVTSNDLLINDAKMKCFSVNSAVIVNTDFAATNYNVSSGSISTYVNVTAQDFTSAYVQTNLQLLLEGNAVFTNTGTKTVNVMTSTSGAVQVPIIIQGDGMLNVYTNVSSS